jgi:hypothetical protein
MLQDKSQVTTKHEKSKKFRLVSFHQHGPFPSVQVSVEVPHTCPRGVVRSPASW